MRTLAKQILHAGLPVPRVARPLIRCAYRVGVVAVETLVLMRKLLWTEPLLRSVCEEVGKGLRAERLPYMRGNGLIRIGNGVNLSGRSCFYFMRGMPETPRIEIGSNVFVGNGCTLCAGRRIVIGDNCLLSAGVRIHDNDGHPLDAGKRRRGDRIGPDDASPVTIEDNVWIGAGATILKGVTVGRNSIVGTGAVVTHDVPPDSVAAGNPAQVCRERPITPRQGEPMSNNE